ncbi:hypothetical protein G6F70_009115 [Rhizopus microsporus]|nr:hypothetical protein G6F71_009051 [Rhizopus microsporus]KAG1193133.1 hypothetical protein G6F70_009115 [Rhizopus microsporus]KAG1206115.1 hypothetical protein G6F69_009066 [Rhizopus microsporus]KAG1226206.1 hypothetical protein G6F67_009072 [Rhizopus microsporus]KAG1264180.1 hypothetical protein G6F68_004550 [Rhizopus microsporus]
MSHKKCPQCKDRILSKKHKYEYHTQTVDIQLKKETITCVRNESDKFICPLCPRFFITATSISRHIRNKHDEEEEEHDVEEEHPEEEEFSLTVVPRSLKPMIPEKQIEVADQTFRDNDNAIINASGLIHRSSREQVSSLKIIRALELVPFAFVDSDNNEENALAHKDAIHKIIGMKRPVEIQYCLPAKRECKCIEETSNNFQISQSISLQNIIESSYMHGYLSGKKYFEMDDDTCKLLNSDWVFQPQMRFFCARVLAGAILVNRMTGEALLINTIEVYGRFRTIDSHYERFNMKKNMLPPTSLPPNNTRYQNVCLTTIRDSDGVKLLVGTKVFNGLVTSSIRIDKELFPEVGPTTSNFVLDNEYARKVEIYIEETAWYDAKKLAEDESAQEVYSFNILYQLRQLRSKFHHYSTYFSCRGYSTDTNDHVMQPYTVWTYCNFDGQNDENSDGRIASKLFQDIAIQVMRFPETAKIEEKRIQSLVSQCKGEKVKEIMESILSLFDGSKQIKIIENKELNDRLSKLAIILNSYIANANNNVMKAISYSIKRTSDRHVG